MGCFYSIEATAVIADWDDTDLESRFGDAVVRCEVEDTRSLNALGLSVVNGSSVKWKIKQNNKQKN